jgi:DNA-binding LacI/PurR family transcriptional regulator
MGNAMSDNGRLLTIQDIARMAGVSRSTVSRVLTDHPRVSNEARSAVEAVIAKTGYRPNRVARSLILGRSSLVAVVVPSISTVFYSELIRGVEEALAGEFTLAVVSTDDDLRLERRAFEQLHDARVAGLVVSTFRHQSEDLFPPGVPVVFANRAPKEPHHSVVISDNFRGGYLATSLLLQHGHRKIGHISASLTLPTSLERHEGYLKALRDGGIEPKPEWSPSGEISLDYGLEIGKRLVAEQAEITGLFTDNDIVAIGVMEALWQEGLSVPRDMSIIGYDDSPFASLVPFSLTSVRTPRRLIGELAGRLVKEAIYARHPIELRKVILPVELVARGSVGRPRRQPHLQARSSRPGRHA